MVRRATVVLSVIGLLWQTAACSSADPSNDAPVAQPSVASPSAPPVPGNAPSSRPPAPPEASSTAPTTTPSRSQPVAPDPTLPSGDVPGPLPFGARTLTGIVERSGDCTMLVVGKRRWALTGEAIGTLVPGAKVTVRGNLAARPIGCGDRDLAQTVLVTRVDPA
jgi:hypothetical protein